MALMEKKKKKEKKQLRRFLGKNFVSGAAGGYRNVKDKWNGIRTV